MFRIRHHIDPSHGVPLPTGTPLSRLVRGVLHMAMADAVRDLARGRQPNLSRWIEPFVQAAGPMVAAFVRDGQKRRARRLLDTIARARSTALVSVRPRKKTLTGPWAAGATGFPQLSYGFDIFNPRIIDFINSTTMRFVQSTLETAADDAWKAYQKTREALRGGLSKGDTQRELNRAIYQIFSDPDRAARIGQTEAARASNGGAYLLAQETGVTNATRWLASSDACPLCLALNGQTRPHGEPYYVNPKGGAYAIVLHAPLHPNCFCVCQDVIADDIDPRSVVALRSVAAS